MNQSHLFMNIFRALKMSLLPATKNTIFPHDFCWTVDAAQEFGSCHKWKRALEKRATSCAIDSLMHHLYNAIITNVTRRLHLGNKLS